MDPLLLAPFYVDDAAFDGSGKRILRLMNLIIERGTFQGYYPEPEKLLFICYPLDQEAEARRYFEG